MRFIMKSFSSFHSFYMLMFYILMNSSYKINLAKASITAAGIENNGEFFKLISLNEIASSEQNV